MLLVEVIVDMVNYLCPSVARFVRLEEAQLFGCVAESDILDGDATLAFFLFLNFINKVVGSAKIKLIGRRRLLYLQ